MMNWSAFGSFPEAALVVLAAGLRGVVLIGAAGIATWLLRHRSAALRHQIWTAAILGQLALLAMVPVMPTIRLPVLPDVTWSTSPSATLTSALPLPTSNVPAQQAASVTVQPAANQSSASPMRASFSWPRIALLIWLGGTFVVVLRFAIGTYNVARLARSSERVADGNWLSLAQRTANRLGIDRPLTLLSGDEFDVPITWGVIYPVVLLPMEAEEWSEERRRLVLVHEMAHVRRFDALTQFLAQIAVAIFWFSPLVWWAEQRMRIEREHACDDVVLRDGTHPALYADELLQMVRSLAARQRFERAPAFAALAMARRTEFEGRMLAILDPARDRRFSNQRLLAFTSMALLAVAMPLAALTPVRGSLAKPSEEKLGSGPAQAGQTFKPSAKSARSGESSQASQLKSSSVASSLPTCSNADLKASSTSTHVHVGDDKPAQRDVKYLATNRGRCLEAVLSGDLLIDDRGQVSRLAAGATAYVRERAAAGDRSLRLRGSGNGAVQSDYRLNNRSVELDAAGREWFADRLREVVRETALDVDARVGRLRAAGQINAVLGEIDRIRSSAAKREYYRALMQTRLTDSETSRVIGQATRDLKSTPSDLKAVLDADRANSGASSASQQRASASNDALEQALAGMTSGAELRTVITVALPNADHDMLLMFARVAETMSSDGEKGMLLRVAAPYYLTRRNQQLQDAYFRTVSTLSSGLEQRDVLITALTFAQGSPSVTRAVIKSTHIMSSSTEKSAVLLSAIGQQLITTDELRTEILTATNTLTDERRQVLEALLKK